MAANKPWWSSHLATDEYAPRVRVGVYGASGNAGTELIRLLLGHPGCAVAFATSREFAGQSLRNVDWSAPDIMLCAPETVDPSQVDVVFVCLPHGPAAACVEQCAAADVRVVDLSGDLRLVDPGTHQQVYGTERNADLMDHVVYGLTETARSAIADARIVSNPGCYPTCVGLALWPLARMGLLDGPIVVNALSGVSGAGRRPQHDTHFCAVVDNVRPYHLGRAHRHVAEIEQNLMQWNAERATETRLVFNPHVIPIERGMLATITLQMGQLSAERILGIYEDAYRAERFVEVLPSGVAAPVRGVVHTNQALIGLHAVTDSNQFVITCAIDNLMKGAAGQAVQNMNLMFGFPDDEGFVVTSGETIQRQAPVVGAY